MFPPVAFAILGKSSDLVRYFSELTDFDCSLKGVSNIFSMKCLYRVLIFFAITYTYYRSNMYTYRLVK